MARCSRRCIDRGVHRCYGERDALISTGAGPGAPQRTPVEPIREVKTFTVQIRDGEVSQKEITHRPTGGVHCTPSSFGPYAEEGHLITVPFAIGRLQMSGVIPPFGLEFGMTKVILRELEAVAGQGPAVQVGLGSGEEADHEEH